jgi:hypothetical protein
MAGSRWRAEFHPECEAWAGKLDQADAEALLAAIRVLRDQGPVLGRPLVDTVQGSRPANMKELRPGSTGRTEVRVLFAFDTERAAILLLGGDKSTDWAGWYTRSIPVADDRFEEHQARLAAREPSGPAPGTATGDSPKKRKGRKRK